MTAYAEAYANLNAAQKEAVDTTEGPLLVIAGPGTGKTQLLGARVANILRSTDTPARNVLCLTFTENGAANMRERLTRFIGKDAYDVAIHTYHAFGSDLIQRYPEYFWESRLETAIDDLTKRQLLLEITEAMSFKNPLRQARHHIGDLMGTISEVKRALLSSDDLRAIARQNLTFVTKANEQLAAVFAGFTKMPGTFAKAAPYFQNLLVALTPLVPSKSAAGQFEPLAQVCVGELVAAYKKAEESGKSKPLTEWKNDWLNKDADNAFVVAGQLESLRISALADALDAYQAALAGQGLFDFDDMILRSIAAMEKHPDLRYTLHERYLYVLLDEFQDTNAAQLRLIQLLTDNPVSEGRPNVMAVGDDDQAIYAFQGAQYSNMVEFYEMYKNTKVINLHENYRSHADILTTAGNLAQQIEQRLENRFDGMTKTLTAANPTTTAAHVGRREFQSDIAERAWISDEIQRLIKSGVSPSEIAILAPKHKQLEVFVPYLNALDIPVRYEKRENILETPIVRQLVVMSRLIMALATDQEVVANALWPQVLSYEFWGIATTDIWQTSWQVSDARAAGAGRGGQATSWSRVLLASDNPQLRQAALVLLAAASHVATDNLETMLDYLIGSEGIPAPGEEPIFSPMRNFYTATTLQHDHPELFYETLSHLTVLRSKLRDFQERDDTALMLPDLLRFIAMYEAAEQPLINTSPYAQAADSVQLMTVFKAKGLEYQHVFLPNCLDDVWGSSSRGNRNKLTLPANLRPIRHAGATDDERLRILFVAVTRAKAGLYLTSTSRSFSGKVTKRLKFLDEQLQDDGSFRSHVLPDASGQVISDDHEAPAAEMLALDWRTRHSDALNSIDMAGLLKDRLAEYQVSPTDILSFIDLEYGGPQKYFFDYILRFPRAPTLDSQFGTAIHETLEWCQHQTSEFGYAPMLADVLGHFEQRLRAKKLTEQRTLLELERGIDALTAFVDQRGSIFVPGAIVERSFRNEGVFCGGVHMSGRIDRIEIDPQHKTIAVVDYKTGKSYSDWKNDIKLHKNRLQLYLYKLLLEGSKTYREYTVTTGRIEFVEPDENGKIHQLTTTFDDKELQRTRDLVQAVWSQVRSLEFPDVAAYPATYKGVLQFEDDLILKGRSYTGLCL